MCFLVIIWVMAKITWEIKRNWVGQQHCHRTDNEPGDDDRRRRQRDSVLSGVVPHHHRHPHQGSRSLNVEKSHCLLLET